MRWLKVSIATDQMAQCLDECWEAILCRLEQRRRITVHGHAFQLVGVLDGADEVFELAQVLRDLHKQGAPSAQKDHTVARVLATIRADHGTYAGPEKDSCNASSYEALPGLFRRQLDQWGFAKEEAKQIGHDVVAHYHGDWCNEPERSCLG